MEEHSTTHPDEGTIHAWLDGALDAPAAAGIAEHVRTCAACAERVAEARGLIAGTSRIVASLDGGAVGTRPAWAQGVPESGSAAAPAAKRDEGSLWRWLHVTPTRAAVAATILVALGITMTRTRSGPDDVRVAVGSGALTPRAATTGKSASAAAVPAPAAERDPLLDSALRKNVAIAQPPRELDAVRRPAVPVPEPSAPAIGLAGVDTTAPSRVAAARQAVAAKREQRSDMADKARVDGAVAAIASADRAAPGTSPAEASMGYVGGRAPGRSLVGVATQCYRIESSTPGATWGGEPLPLVIVADSAARSGQAPVRVLTAAGRPTPLSAQLHLGGADSLTLSLRRIGFTGSIALGPDVGGRAGTAFSAPTASQLEEMVVTGYGAGERDAAASARAVRKSAGAAAAGSAPAAAPAPARPATPQSGASQVTMRPTGCPAP